jgi:hypothetical protein
MNVDVPSGDPVEETFLFGLGPDGIHYWCRTKAWLMPEDSIPSARDWYAVVELEESITETNNETEFVVTRVVIERGLRRLSEALPLISAGRSSAMMGSLVQRCALAATGVVYTGFGHTAHYAEILDADVADVVIQYGLFGELVFS